MSINFDFGVIECWKNYFTLLIVNIKEFKQHYFIQRHLGKIINT